MVKFILQALSLFSFTALHANGQQCVCAGCSEVPADKAFVARVRLQGSMPDMTTMATGDPMYFRARVAEVFKNSGNCSVKVGQEIVVAADVTTTCNVVLQPYTEYLITKTSFPLAAAMKNGYETIDVNACDFVKPWWTVTAGERTAVNALTATACPLDCGTCPFGYRDGCQDCTCKGGVLEGCTANPACDGQAGDQFCNPQPTCDPTPRTCPGGFQQSRDPFLNCEYPDCPTFSCQLCPNGYKMGCTMCNCMNGQAACITVQDCVGPAAEPHCNCDDDVQTCEDGSTVTRDPLNNCEFTPCQALGGGCPGAVGCDPVPIAQCSPDTQTCPDGVILRREVNLECAFPECPKCCDRLMKPARWGNAACANGKEAQCCPNGNWSCDWSMPTGGSQIYTCGGRTSLLSFGTACPARRLRAGE